MNDARKRPRSLPRFTPTAGGWGHFKGADQLTNSPCMEASPVELMKAGRILPLELGGLEGDGPWSAFLAL